MRHGCSLNPIPSPRELLFSISSPSTNRSVPQTMIKMVQTDHIFVDTDSSQKQCWGGFCYWHAGLAHHSDVDLWTHQKNLEKCQLLTIWMAFGCSFLKRIIINGVCDTTSLFYVNASDIMFCTAGKCFAAGIIFNLTYKPLSKYGLPFECSWR